MKDTALCCCGKALNYSVCCGRWHAGPEHLLAPSAEALMRSRYSAYVLGLTDYVLHTWHASTRPAHVAANEPGLRWLGLEVRRAALLDARHAEVEFVARHKLAGRAARLHEISRFVLEGGRWFYLDGVGG